MASTCFSLVFAAVGGHAGMVRGGVPCQREERRHHGRTQRNGDSAGDWHRQLPAPHETTLSHPGDGQLDQPFGATHQSHGTENKRAYSNGIFSTFSLLCIMIFFRRTHRLWHSARWTTSGWAITGCPRWDSLSIVPLSWNAWSMRGCWRISIRKICARNSKWSMDFTGTVKPPSLQWRHQCFSTADTRCTSCVVWLGLVHSHSLVCCKSLNSFNLCRASLEHGVALLKRLNYNRKELEERRRRSESELLDVVVWTNDRVIRWIRDIGLKEFADSLLESGVHGAVLALDEQFTCESLALALQIPNANRYVRFSLCGYPSQIKRDEWLIYHCAVLETFRFTEKL